MNLIGFLGQIIGFLIFIGIIYLIIKNKGNHPDMFQLTDGEEIVEMTKGDWWIQEFLWQYSQNSGEFAFTNKRIMFKGSLAALGKEASIPYEEILDIKPSFVLCFPVAFIIKTKEQKEYKFAMMKRNHYIELINSLAQKNMENE